MIKSLYDAHPEALVNSEVLTILTNAMHVLEVAVQDFLITQLRYTTQANDLQGIITRDEYGRLPLHNALREGAPLGSIKLLVQADVSTLLMSDSNGVLPLHTAFEHHGCPNVGQYLLEQDARSLLLADNQGNTPLHCACRLAKFDVIAMLVNEYPTAAVATTNANKHLPIQLLLANNHSHHDQESAGFVSSIFLLLRANPESLMNDMEITLEMARLSISGDICIV